jgi:putative CocE/NonD family hydrolase
LRGRAALAPAYAAFPADPGDETVTGGPVGFYRDWLAHNAPGDPWWQQVDFGDAAAAMPPVTMQAGLYDLFLPAQLTDYQALLAAGRQARLRIGPWTHTSPASLGASLRDALEWFDVHLRGAADHRSAQVAPVRVYVLGTGGWAALPEWPPPAVTESWRLQPGGGLAPADPPESAPDRYRYDPADPTPGIGGTSLDMRHNGPKDNRRREARADVLCYTSAVLAADLTVAGPLSARLFLRSDTGHADYFVRLCDVRPGGRSVNISDGIIRLRPGDAERDADGVFTVPIPMWSTAAMFKRGHRLRLQVTGGAHPAFPRNPGTGDPLGSVTGFRAADHEVLHDREHPSAIDLPVANLSVTR